MNGLVELTAECDARGIRLLPAGGDGLKIDAPQDVLTPDLMERLKAHKGELLAALGSDQCRHLDRECYRDAPAPGRPGWIRTTCRRCDRFIGYRPAHDHHRRRDAAAGTATETKTAYGSSQPGTER